MSRQLHADESDLALARTVRALSDCLNYRNPQTPSWALDTLESLCTQPLPRAGCSFPTTLAALSPPVSERDLDSKTPRFGDERNHATRAGLDDDGTEAEKATGLRPVQSEPPFVNEGIIIIIIMEGPKCPSGALCSADACPPETGETRPVSSRSAGMSALSRKGNPVRTAAY